MTAIPPITPPTIAPIGADFFSGLAVGKAGGSVRAGPGAVGVEEGSGDEVGVDVGVDSGVDMAPITWSALIQCDVFAQGMPYHPLGLPRRCQIP